MSDPFNPHARQQCISDAEGRFHRQVARLISELYADARRHGFAHANAGQILQSTFPVIESVVIHDVLESCNDAADYELQRIRIQGKARLPARNPCDSELNRN